MPQFILDTDTLTLLRQGNTAIIQKLQEIDPNEVAITAITVEEQLSGWYTLMRQLRSDSDLERAYERLAQTVRFVGRLPILGFSQDAIVKYRNLLSQKLNIGKMDLRIAAIALECNATVVTRNARDFGRVPALTIADWTRTE
ncbi:type II toxin-antitoxin system VapC family toxin [Armatimonas sp.]|uniref:type II toxin-antitoxin system VapC family toxin n=1 Tax=Armatimonas sp. TaxID=1872638 RepID=UPI00286B6FAB|nr:type II toxin-antitoxin system VapC family toxin [Armatimonas sp.]